MKFSIFRLLIEDAHPFMTRGMDVYESFYREMKLSVLICSCFTHHIKEAGPCITTIHRQGFVFPPARSV